MKEDIFLIEEFKKNAVVYQLIHETLDDLDVYTIYKNQSIVFCSNHKDLAIYIFSIVKMAV